MLAGYRLPTMNLVRYAVAILSVAAAALVSWGARTLLIPDVLSAITIAVFTAAVLVTAWLSGIGPGIAAVVLGAMTLDFLLSGRGHSFALLAPRDTAVIVAFTALSALIAFVVARLHASHAALLLGLPAIERHARDRANDAALRKIEEERRIAEAARAEVAHMQLALRQRNSAAMAAVTARAAYLTTARQAVRLPLHSLERYAARLTTSAGDDLAPLQRRDLDGVVLCQEHMVALLETLLAPTRVESAQLLPTNAEVSLSDVLAQASALAEPVLAAHGIKLEYATADVPHVRGDAAILTQVLARLLLDEAAIAALPHTVRLDATEIDGGVAIDCRTTLDRSVTVDDRSGELPLEQAREEMESAVPSSVAAELVRQMGGTVTKEGVPGGEFRFKILLSTQAPARDVMEASAPVTLWPPVAFELPRTTIARRAVDRLGPQS
jgi:signal transduction histidine kinase